MSTTPASPETPDLKELLDNLETKLDLFEFDNNVNLPNSIRPLIDAARDVVEIIELGNHEGELAAIYNCLSISLTTSS